MRYGFLPAWLKDTHLFMVKPQGGMEIWIESVRKSPIDGFILVEYLQPFIKDRHTIPIAWTNIEKELQDVLKAVFNIKVKKAGKDVSSDTRGITPNLLPK